MSGLAVFTIWNLKFRSILTIFNIDGTTVAKIDYFKYLIFKKIFMLVIFDILTQENQS